MLKELRPLNIDHIRRSYLSNRDALEFMVLMAIYYCFHNLDKVAEVSSLMHSINLMEEAQDFMDSPGLRKFLEVLYEYTGELEEYKSFEATILDVAVMKQL